MLSSVAENTRLILRADHRDQRDERNVFRDDATQQSAFVLDR